MKDKTESEKWLREFASKWNFDYDEMIREASAQAIEHTKESWEHYIVARGIDLHDRSELGKDEELFWHHVSMITGLVATLKDRESFGWSCSC